MVAGIFVLGIFAGFGAAAAALIAGHALWVAALAYVVGGMLGMIVGAGLRLGLGIARTLASGPSLGLSDDGAQVQAQVRTP